MACSRHALLPPPRPPANIYDWLNDILAAATAAQLSLSAPPFTNLHCVVTSDLLKLEHLLKTEFPNFPKGQYFCDTVCDLLDDGIFNTVAAAEAVTRAATRNEASREMARAMMEALMKEVIVADAALAGFGVACMACCILWKSSAKSSVFGRILKASSIEISGLRSVLSGGDGSSSSGQTGDELSSGNDAGMLMVARGTVDLKCAVEKGNLNCDRGPDLLVSLGSGEKGVIVQRTINLFFVDSKYVNLSGEKGAEMDRYKEKKKKKVGFFHVDN